MKKIPILLITHNRPYLLDKVLERIIKFTPWDDYELWILDNCSTIANRRIIAAYLEKYKFINIFSQKFNQIAVIQNEIIKKLKCDFYIKLDDDIFVTENWYKSFLGVLERNSKDLSIGTVVIPINGFGWKIFLEKMDLTYDFKMSFPTIELIQGCMEPAVWDNPYVCDYIWNKSLNMDSTTKQFMSNQNRYQDIVIPCRYSIGAIIFTHNFWQKMGGWKVDDSFRLRYIINNKLSKINLFIAQLRRKDEQKRIAQIIDIITNTNVSALGVEEEYLYQYSMNNGYKQYLTTEGIVYHFAFSPTEDYIMRTSFLKIRY